MSVVADLGFEVDFEDRMAINAAECGSNRRSDSDASYTMSMNGLLLTAPSLWLPQSLNNNCSPRDRCVRGGTKYCHSRATRPRSGVFVLYLYKRLIAGDESIRFNRAAWCICKVKFCLPKHPSFLRAVLMRGVVSLFPYWPYLTQLLLGRTSVPSEKTKVDQTEHNSNRREKAHQSDFVGKNFRQ